jgi:hypothetical protein
MAEPLAASSSSYKDRGTGLLVFGIFELCLGLLCLVIAGFTFLSLSLAAQNSLQMGPAISPRQLLPSLSIYLGAAAFLFTVGVGSILARRWARALMLVFSWLWGIVGAVSLLFMIFFLPDFFARIAARGGTEASVPLAAMQGCAWAALFLFFLVLPAVFILFYRSPHVRATCEVRDYRERWTDRVPLPLLGLSLALAYGGIGVLLSLPQGVVLLFGRIWTGWPAIVLILLVSAVFCVLAVATYLRLAWAWPALLGLWGLGVVSAALFVWTGFDWKALYAAMNMPTQGIEALGLDQLFRGPRFAIPVGLSALAGLGFLIWVRRYFRAETPSPSQP